IERILQNEPLDLPAWAGWLQELDDAAAKLPGHVVTLAAALHEAPEELQRWTVQFAEQVREQREELRAIVPWAELLREDPRTESRIKDRGRTIQQPLADGEPGYAERGRELRNRLTTVLSIADLQEQMKVIQGELAASAEPASSLLQSLTSSKAGELQTRCQRLADRAAALAREMDFRLLYNQQRHLFSIGYNLGLNR